MTATHEQQIEFEDRDDMYKLFGAYDEYLRILREAFRVQFVARGTTLRIKGERETVEQAMAAVRELVEAIRGQGSLSREVVESAVRRGRKELEETRAAEATGLPPKPRTRSQVKPLSTGQAAYMSQMDAHDIVFSIGPAGTGKTFLAVARAVDALQSGQVRKIVLVRPAVEAGERLGYLPGDLVAKINPYLRPLYDSLHSLLETGQLKKLMDADVVEIVPLAYMRGRTLEHAFIILDEAQNTTGDQMKMFLTRMGRHSRIVATGDVTQVDLPPGKKSGLVQAVELLSHIPEIGISKLSTADIVRHPLVRKIVDAYEGRKGKSGRGRQN